VPAELATALRRLEPALGALEGEPVALDGGITNRNYRVTLGGAPLVVRLCGKRTGPLGIDRDTECLAAERASELGIGPPVVARLPAEGVLVCAFVDGAPLEQDELRRPRVLGEVASALRAFHAGPPLPTAFAVFRLVADQGDLGAAVPADHAELLGIAHRIERALAGHPEHAPVPCHNDLLRANLLRTTDGLRLVDWEYAGMNDRYFDLGNLAANNGLGDEDEHALLAAYWGEPATPRLRIDEAIGALDPDGADGALQTAGAVAVYLAYRRDELGGAPAELLRLAARAEFDGDPPASVAQFLAEAGIDLR
jgi:thiamine kinase-like enzyme